MNKKIGLTGIFLILLSNMVSAHGGHSTGTFMSGVMHPILGVDHLLTMICVGVISLLMSYQSSKKSVWVVPLLFVGSLIIGGVFGINGIHVPFVETLICISMMLLGGIIFTNVLLCKKRLPYVYGIIILFGFIHGNAHGIEAPGVGILKYIFGFVVASISLHVLGIYIGTLINKSKYKNVISKIIGIILLIIAAYLLF